MKSTLFTSWKTTVFAFVAASPIILAEILAAVNGQEVNLERIIAAAGILGLGVVARDGNKSSQDHQIR